MFSVFIDDSRSRPPVQAYKGSVRIVDCLTFHSPYRQKRIHCECVVLNKPYVDYLIILLLEIAIVKWGDSQVAFVCGRPT